MAHHVEAESRDSSLVSSSCLSFRRQLLERAERRWKANGGVNRRRQMWGLWKTLPCQRRRPPCPGWDPETCGWWRPTAAWGAAGDMSTDLLRRTSHTYRKALHASKDMKVHVHTQINFNSQQKCAAFVLVLCVYVCYLQYDHMRVRVLLAMFVISYCDHHPFLRRRLLLWRQIATTLMIEI